MNEIVESVAKIGDEWMNMVSIETERRVGKQRLEVKFILFHYSNKYDFERAVYNQLFENEYKLDRWTEARGWE